MEWVGFVIPLLVGSLPAPGGYSAAVVTLPAVLERWSVAGPLWAVEQDEFLVTVARLPTPDQVGAVVWALVGRSITADDLSLTVADTAEAIEAYLSCDDEDYAPGGLRVAAGDVVIDPGCCVGLDQWRDWLDVVDGKVIDLGHDPDVLLEHRGPVIRLWQDKHQLLPGELPGPSDPYIDIRRDDLPLLLQGVRQDLVGFLAALHRWAHHIVPDSADLLTVAVDRRLRISAPLDV
jgi:hypothetical protein